MNWLKKRPWLWVILAFVILISAWTAFITIAVNNQPELIDIHDTQTNDEAPITPPPTNP